MAPKTTKQLASEYIELIKKARGHKQILELCSAWLAKHLSIIHRHKDEARYDTYTKK